MEYSIQISAALPGDQLLARLGPREQALSCPVGGLGLGIPEERLNYREANMIHNRAYLARELRALPILMWAPISSGWTFAASLNSTRASA